MIPEQRSTESLSGSSSNRKPTPAPESANAQLHTAKPATMLAGW